MRRPQRRSAFCSLRACGFSGAPTASSAVPKSAYGHVVDFVSNEVAPGGCIVSDLWWLDQIAASAISERRLMYVPSPADAHAVMQRLSRAVVPIVTVIRSESESPDVGAWREDTCYVEIKRDRLDVRRLVAITLHHRCGQ
jgi:hypothetical protein